VAVANGGACGDVGAVLERDVRADVSRGRGRRGRREKIERETSSCAGRFPCRVHVSRGWGFGGSGGLLVLGLSWKRGRVQRSPREVGAGQEGVGLMDSAWAPWPAMHKKEKKGGKKRGRCPS
jgi:hypothetical protein